MEQLFTAPKQVLFRWPTSNPSEFLEETMEWVTPEWVHLLRATINGKETP